MSSTNAEISNNDSILESLTRTLLYEGYALFPYHRSAIKNQKPIPFGVVYPGDHSAHNHYEPSDMQTECILTGDKNLAVNVDVRFLHLKRIEVFKKNIGEEGNDKYDPVYELNLPGRLFQSGWQTLERKSGSGDLLISQLIENPTVISFKFEEKLETNYIYEENGDVAGKQHNSILEVKGNISIEGSEVHGSDHAYRISVLITNTTAISNASIVNRDEICRQSFLSTHTILNSTNGEFISVQNPGKKWDEAVAQCTNRYTWPILIEENNRTLLSSPIILYDYPKINPRSNADLFDSLEIEEALMLHFATMSDEEKQRIAMSDEKLRSMLNKIGQVTPGEIINLHGGFSDSMQPAINNNKDRSDESNRINE